MHHLALPSFLTCKCILIGGCGRQRDMQTPESVNSLDICILGKGVKDRIHNWPGHKLTRAGRWPWTVGDLVSSQEEEEEDHRQKAEMETESVEGCI